MNRLLDIGFEIAGHWSLDGEKIAFQLLRHSTQQNVLYAFVCDGEMMYVGKTTVSLRRRMLSYRSPGGRQTTNINNNRRIREALLADVAVDILALPDSGLLRFGQFHLNLAAALEDDIIRAIQPAWNGGMKEPAEAASGEWKEAEAAGEAEDRSDSFTFVLQPTYYRTGFFNVGVDSSAQFGADAERLEIFLGDAQRPVLGTITRTANRTRVPHNMGGVAVRYWFQHYGQENGTMVVEVIPPTAIAASGEVCGQLTTRRIRRGASQALAQYSQADRLLGDHSCFSVGARPRRCICFGTAGNAVE